ncbi:MAG: UbiD family decarboxylase [Bacteroidales bacterium]|nr:UbiD family decarboxylase [Bacteroidales bacterium]MBR5671175.1 UbiD family decarboxylase [Bacteroidales bacterium]
MDIKAIETFIPDADGRIRQYIADTLGDDFKVKMTRKQPACHHSVKYNVDFNQTSIAEAGSAALIWKEPVKGLYRMSGASLRICSKDTLMVKAGAAEKLRNDLLNSTFRLPVVIIFGGDPLYGEMHSIDVPDQIDAYWACGFIREGNVQVIDCFTQDLLIPVDCAVTTEGYFQRNELKDTDDGEMLFHASCFTQPL